MITDAAGLALIKGFEGLRLIAYQDSAGVWTIGYGSTRYKNGSPVKHGDTLVNEACASDLLQVTLGQYENAVNRDVKVPLTQNQFNALVSFTYNEGTGALAESHLLIKLNQKDFAGAADEFLKWDEITSPTTHQKEVLNDLYVRRTKERALFLKP
jgi:lysozyme